MVWCEITIIAPQNLSPLGILVQDLRTNPALLQIFSMLFLCYLSVCAMFGIFRMKVSRFYCMVSKRRTDAQSLLFNAMNTLRVSVPLTYNFVSLMKLRVRSRWRSLATLTAVCFSVSLDQNTTFEEVMGEMTAIPFFGSQFNDWCPLLVLLPMCLLTAFNLSDRLLKRCNAQFSHAGGQQDENTAEGMMILRKEKRRRKLPVDDLVVQPLSPA